MDHTDTFALHYPKASNWRDEYPHLTTESRSRLAEAR